MKHQEKIDLVYRILDKETIVEKDFDILISLSKTNDWELNCLIIEALGKFEGDQSKRMLLDYLDNKSFFG